MGQNSGHGLYESASMALVFEVRAIADTQAFNKTLDKGSTIAAGVGDLDLRVGDTLGPG